jgi:hypothetical protein
MANNPTVGVFIPGTYLNQCNSPYPTGQGDVYGNSYPSGLNVGKQIEIGTTLAQALTNPAGANQLFEGAYQWIQVDSGATAANVQPGLAAFIKLDPGGTAGVEPELGWQQMTVTDQSHADSINLWAGVFIEAIPPGNYGFIFVGAGRVEVTYRGTLSNAGTLGDIVGVYTGGNGLFDDLGATTVSPVDVGFAVTTPIANGTSAIYVPTARERIPLV